MRGTLFGFRLLYFRKQIRQCFDVRGSYVRELLAVQFTDRHIQLLQELQALAGDAGFDDAAVVGLPLAGDQAAFFHAVEEPGHVRVARDHAFRDGAAGKTVGFGAAKDAEHVVLSGSEAALLEKLFRDGGEAIGGMQDREEKLLLGKGGARAESFGA